MAVFFVIQKAESIGAMLEQNYFSQLDTYWKTLIPDFVFRTVHYYLSFFKMCW